MVLDQQTARYEVYADRVGLDVRKALGITFNRGIHGWEGTYAVVPNRTVALLRKMTAAGSGATPQLRPVSCERVKTDHVPTASVTGISRLTVRCNTSIASRG